MNHLCSGTRLSRANDGVNEAETEASASEPFDSTRASRPFASLRINPKLCATRKIHAGRFCRDFPRRRCWNRARNNSY